MRANCNLYFAAFFLVLVGCSVQGHANSTSDLEAAAQNPGRTTNLFSEPLPDSTRLDAIERSARLCEGSAPNLYRNERGNYLLACECNCTSHDNMGWFISLQAHQVQGLALGKPATEASIQDRNLIEDVISSHPFCSRPAAQDIDRSDFISLIKYPTGDDASPYCFEVRSIIEAGGGIELVEAGETLDPSDEEAFRSSSNEVKSEIMEIVRTYSPDITSKEIDSK